MENQKISFDELPLTVLRLEKKVDELMSLIEAQNMSTTAPLDTRFTVAEAAAFLDLKTPTVYTKFSRGELPGNKVGGRLYFFESDLRDYIRQGRKRTNREILQSI